MTEAAPERAASEPPMIEPAPVDLAVLAVQTGHDGALQREVLLLFAADAGRQVELMRSQLSAERRAAAHRLVGSARAVGAGEVARLAAEIERGRGDVAAVEAAVDRARRFISAHLEDADGGDRPR